MRIPDHLSCFLRNIYVGQEAKLDLVWSNWPSKLEKEYNRVRYCNPDYLTICRIVVVVVQLPSRVRLFVTPCIATCQTSLFLVISHSLTKFMSIESKLPSNHFILCCLLLLLPSIFPSIRVFSSESALHIRWPKYWSFSFSITPSNEYSRLISFRTDWFYFLAVQGALKSLLQHHDSKASILWHSNFLTVQLSRVYMSTGENW